MTTTGWMMTGAAVLGLACGGGGSGGGGGGGSQTCTPGPTAAITITASGLSPINVCVQPGGQVTFTNRDSAASHDIEFESGGCPTVGEITSGASKTATFPTSVNCTFHDGHNPSSTAFRGTVAVSSAMVSGGGY